MLRVPRRKTWKRWTIKGASSSKDLLPIEERSAEAEVESLAKRGLWFLHRATDCLRRRVRSAAVFVERRRRLAVKLLFLLYSFWLAFNSSIR